MARRSLPVVALLALAVLAGCSTLAPLTPAEPERTPSGTPTVGGDAVPSDSERFSAEVVHVVDGDTVNVRYGNDTVDTVRLVGIDTPETRGGTNPPEFEGVPDTEAGRVCLATAADNATDALHRMIADEQIVLAVDSRTDRRDRYDRLLAYVVHDGANVNERLVERGHARVYDTRFAFADRFYEHERRAQDARRGLWQCTDPSSTTDGALAVRVSADAPGDDRENPNGEFVTITNTGDDLVDIGNWTVSDAANHTYTFPPNATIPANESIRLYSGSGTDTATEFYWGNGAIWNNAGDTATIRAENGTVVAEESH